MKGCIWGTSVPEPDALQERSLLQSDHLKIILTQATPSTARHPGVAAYAAQYGSIMPQYIENAPALVQTTAVAPPVAATAVAESVVAAAAPPHIESALLQATPTSTAVGSTAHYLS